tara:strand:+ start:504 stop:950 length:447 start_codon:yes stop_codon:yes gene_type:complete
MIQNKNIIFLIRLIMGLVFIIAAYPKILDPNAFSSNIHNYGVTPLYIENLIALILPWIELFIGISLIVKYKYESSLDICIYLMIGFTILISQAYIRGLSIDCGCFLGSDTESDSKRFWMLIDIIRDIVFLALLFILKYDVRKNKELHA